MGELEDLRLETRAFAEARDWGPFHTPKNLAMAIAGEAGELVAEFRWLTPEESAPERLAAQHRRAIEFEIADVVREKLATNESRFPPVR